jgi:hypothetical protein
MNKKVLVIVLALALNIAVVAVAPVFAKNMHVPEGVEISYFSGGEIRVATWPSFPSLVPQKLLIHVMDIEEASFGSGDLIIILLWWPTAPPPSTEGYWLPLATFTTNPDSVEFLKDLFYFSPLNSPASEKNTIPVSEDELIVDRHGNEIFASLTSQMIQLRKGTGWVSVTIPAFTIELTKIGGSIHNEDSGSYQLYTIYGESMGFNANGVFSARDTGGSYTYTTDTDCVIKMHAIQTFVPNT